MTDFGQGDPPGSENNPPGSGQPPPDQWPQPQPGTQPDNQPGIQPPPDPQAASNPPPPPQAGALPVPQTPGPAAGHGTGQTGGWYNGPLPIADLAPKETIGAAIGRTAVKSLTVLVVFGVGLFIIPLLLIFALVGAAGDSAADPGTARTLVAGENDADINLVAIEISGVILGEDPGNGGGLFAPTDVTYGYTIQEELEELADDSSVDGVILEVNSPGGTIFGSKAIADGVAAYKESTGNPVIAYVSGISASGGVYSMAGADEIYADHGTLIGSIGVIFGPFATYNNVTAIDGGILGGGVTTEDGITFEYLTAGRSKDFGNPYRPISDEERKVLQEGLDDAYGEFVALVSAGRGISEAEIVNDLGALIFGEQQAVANGLIDGVANRTEGYELAAVAAGQNGEETWKVERLETGTPGLLELFSGRLVGEDTSASTGESQIAGLGSSPLCLGTGTFLAYHGDPALLCSGR